MAISLRKHSGRKRTAARPPTLLDKITAALDSIPVTAWLIEPECGDVLYANAYALTSCHWRGRKRRPLRDLSTVLRFGRGSTSSGIALADLQRMSRARKPAVVHHGTLKLKSGAARRVYLRATPLATAEHGMLVLLSAEAATSRSPRNPPGATRWALDIAHNLNNIGASLMGFVELASEANQGNVALQPFIDEFRLVYSRLTQLAGSLELLSEARAPLKTTTLQNIPALQPPSGGAEYALHWKCDPQTRVRVNAETLRRTLQGLAALAPAPGADGVIEYTLYTTGVATTCSACGVAVASGAVRIRAKTGRTKGDVYFDAIIAGVHRVGGHVRWQSHPANFAILLPVVK